MIDDATYHKVMGHGEVKVPCKQFKNGYCLYDGKECFLRFVGKTNNLICVDMDETE